MSESKPVTIRKMLMALNAELFSTGAVAGEDAAKAEWFTAPPSEPFIPTEETNAMAQAASDEVAEDDGEIIEEDS